MKWTSVIDMSAWWLDSGRQGNKCNEKITKAYSVHEFEIDLINLKNESLCDSQLAVAGNSVSTL